MKSEGVKDVVKWLEIQCKKQKKEVEKHKKQNSSFFIDNEYGDYLKQRVAEEQAKLSMLVNVKRSVEKYMKKLQHQGECRIGK